METVTKVDVIRPYVLVVEFADGTRREIDVEDILTGPMFEPLKDESIFRQAAVDAELGTVVWPNGADLSPEFLRHGDRKPVKN